MSPTQAGRATYLRMKAECERNRTKPDPLLGHALPERSAVEVHCCQIPDQQLHWASSAQSRERAQVIVNSSTFPVALRLLENNRSQKRFPRARHRSPVQTIQIRRLL